MQIKKNFSTACLTVGATLFFAATSPANAAAQSEPKRLTEEEARDQLEKGIPSWDADQLLREAPPIVWEAPARPREFALKFVDKELTFAERRGGRDLYWSADRDVYLAADEARGLFTLLRSLDNEGADAGAFTLDSAEKAAREIYRSAGASELEQGEVIRTDVMEASPNEKPEAVARHVRFHRRANGLRVRDSLWMVTFDLKGNPFRIEAKWPQFKLLKVDKLHSKDDALKALEPELAVISQSKSGIGHVEVSLAYEPVQGAFEPVLSVWTFPGDGLGSPGLLQFSLASGLLPLATFNKNDPPSDT